MSKPSVGRIVRYRTHGTPMREDGTQAFPSCEECAAFITQVEEGSERVGLLVIHPDGFQFQSLAKGGSDYFAGENAPGGTWFWPPRD